MENNFDSNYLNELISDFVSGNSRSFGDSYNRVEMDMADAFMKHKGYHKFWYCVSPKYARCYYISYSKEYEPSGIIIDGYFRRRIY